MATISEALAIAIQHHQAGRLQAAEDIYRKILAAQPNHGDAWHLLGLIASQTGRPQAALEIGWWWRSTAISPPFIAIWGMPSRAREN